MRTAPFGTHSCIQPCPLSWMRHCTCGLCLANQRPNAKSRALSNVVLSGFSAVACTAGSLLRLWRHPYVPKVLEGVTLEAKSTTDTHETLVCTTETREMEQLGENGFTYKTGPRRTQRTAHGAENARISRSCSIRPPTCLASMPARPSHVTL